MTLYKQIMILLMMLFMALFSSVIYVSANNIHDYMKKQLASHAQDAATSLGIVLSSDIQQQDNASIETHINAMFDSGYYHKIKIVNADNETIFDKTKPITAISQVPDWYVNFYQLLPVTQKSTVMSGWVVAGTIYVASAPDFAYVKMWDNMVSLFIVFSAFVVFLFVFTAFALNILLKPLQAIKLQSEAIVKREFPEISIKPQTLEFSSLVDSLNHMARKLKTLFEEQASHAAFLQRQAYQDDVTPMRNRRFFDKQIEFYTHSKDYQLHGLLVILQLDPLEEFNKYYGHLKGNKLLSDIANILIDAARIYPEHFTARLTGTQFAIVLKSATEDIAHALAMEIKNQISTLAHTFEPQFYNLAHFGIVFANGSIKSENILANADIALRQAQIKGENAYHILTEDLAVDYRGASDWEQLITQALDNGQFEIYLQSIINDSNLAAMSEVTLQLVSPNQSIRASLFIPMSEYLNLSSRIDKWVITQIIKYYLPQTEQTLFINLSRQSLIDPTFPSWLMQEIKPLSPDRQKQLVFEFSEFYVQNNLPEFTNLVNIVRDIDCHFSIDHFGINLSLVNWLQGINITYLKVHGSLTHLLAENPETINYLRQIIQTGHSIDVKIIVEGIENEADYEQCKLLNVDYYQGYHIAKPELISVK